MPGFSQIRVPQFLGSPSPVLVRFVLPNLQGVNTRFLSDSCCAISRELIPGFSQIHVAQMLGNSSLILCQISVAQSLKRSSPVLVRFVFLNLQGFRPLYQSDSCCSISWEFIPGFSKILCSIPRELFPTFSQIIGAQSLGSSSPGFSQISVAQSPGVHPQFQSDSCCSISRSSSPVLVRFVLLSLQGVRPRFQSDSCCSISKEFIHGFSQIRVAQFLGS